MKSLKVAVIGIPGKWSTEVIADALEQKTGYRLVVDMADVSADLQTGQLLANGVDLCKVDGIVVKKISQQYSPDTLDRIELLRLAEDSGVRVFTSPEKIVRMIDRLACTMTLVNGDIPMPPTRVTESIDYACQTVMEFGEAVFKPLFSTKARGMQLLTAQSDEHSLRSAVEVFQAQNKVMYIQQKQDLSGRDFGMIFLGGQYIGSYARVSQNTDWSTVIDKGGKYMPHEPPDSTIELASRAQALFGMDFTTVDVADTPDGPIVFEVSAFGGFKGAKEGLGIDVAQMYADYVIKNLNLDNSENQSPLPQGEG